MTQHVAVTVGIGGDVVIPAEIRDKHGLKPGTRLVLIDSHEGLVIMSRAQALAVVRRQLAGEPSLVDSLLADRRVAAAAGNDARFTRSRGWTT